MLLIYEGGCHEPLPDLRMCACVCVCLCVCQATCLSVSSFAVTRLCLFILWFLCVWFIRALNTMFSDSVQFFSKSSLCICFTLFSDLF